VARAGAARCGHGRAALSRPGCCWWTCLRPTWSARTLVNRRRAAGGTDVAWTRRKLGARMETRRRCRFEFVGGARARAGWRRRWVSFLPVMRVLPHSVPQFLRAPDARTGRKPMAYSDEARRRRRCTATTRAGQPCQAWAVWGDSGQRCSNHAGRHHTGPLGPGFAPRRHATYVPCRCQAYGWPHRPAGGACRWPDSPARQHPTPPSTHRWPRWRRS
jgi:hypothetical protein